MLARSNPGYRFMGDIAAPMKVILWFFANPETETTFKITVVARSVPEARRLLDRMPMDPTMQSYYRENEPSNVWSAPWAQVEVSKEGKAMSYCLEAGR